MTVAFYGDNDGRTVREENRVETNPVPVADKSSRARRSKTIDPNNVCATLAAGEQRTDLERRQRASTSRSTA